MTTDNTAMPINAFDVALAAPWAIQEDWLKTILGIASGNGDVSTALQLRKDAVDAVESVPARRMDGTRRVGIRNGVAILSVRGPIFRYANLFTAVSGATSIQATALDFRSSLDDPDIHSIILNLDSPGGMVAGVNEFSEQVFSARGMKPIIAYAGGMAASAAYWIASAADEIVTDATAELGSIGVVMGYLDTREANKKRGIEEIEIVSSVSPKKRPDPKTEKGKAELQRRVDDIAGVFVNAVARNRGIDTDAVINGYGRGGVMAGQSAVDAGLADRLGSLETLISELAGNASKSKTRSIFMSEITGAPAAQNPVTVESIKLAHPVIARALIDEGRNSIDVAAARDESSRSERDRILSLMDIETVDSRGDIRAAIEDGETTAESMALGILKKQKARGNVALETLAGEGRGSVAARPADGKDNASAWDKSLKKVAV